MRYLVLTAAFLLGGCATTHREPGDLRTTHLVCGGTARLDISHDGQTAVVKSTEGTKIVLKRTTSPLGVQYAGQGGSVLRSGDTYVYTGPSGSPQTCVLLER